MHGRKSRDRRTFRFEPRHSDFQKRGHGKFQGQEKDKKSRKWFEEK